MVVFKKYLVLSSYFKSVCTVSVEATDNMMSYSGGIFNDPTCSPSPSPNHAVTVVGYGVDSSTNLPYWIIKNR